MSKIWISEIDETSVFNTTNMVTDIVFVPGYSVAPISAEEGSLVADALSPVRCNSVAEFERYFGGVTPVFTSAQAYPSEFFGSTESDIATDGTSRNLLDKGSPDTGYIYAKELLTAGIPVVYYRVNKSISDLKIEDMYKAISELSYGKLECTAQYTTTGDVLKTISVDSSKFTEYFTGSGDYKFTKDSNGIRASVTYSGDTFSATIVDELKTIEKKESTNTITLTFTNDAWDKDPVAYGIDITGIPTNDDTITITYSTVATGYNSLTTGLIYTASDIGIDFGSDTPPDELSVHLIRFESELLDRGACSFKYLTSGGYPTFSNKTGVLVNAMISVCATRGDAVALIDHTDNPGRDLVGNSSVFSVVNSSTYQTIARSTVMKGRNADVIEIFGTYGAMFTPCQDVQLVNSYKKYGAGGKLYALDSHIVMPASFAYLMCLAKTIQNNPSWVATAGVTRGRVTTNQSRVLKPLTNSIADSYQPDNLIAVNPITKVNPYGYCIMGNRTLVDNSIKGGTTALSFLNIRNMVSDVKKQVYIAAQSVLFDQNTEITWINFVSLITPILDKMKNTNGISNYKIIRLEGSDRTNINVAIRLYPIYAIESFDVKIYLNDQGTYEDSETI